MDKYIVSSPTQLSQPFESEVNNRPTKSSEENVHGHPDAYTIDKYMRDYTKKDEVNNTVTILDNASSSSRESLDEIVPVSTRIYGDAFNNFQHSKNISLDGSVNFDTRISHKSKPSTSSIASISQEPPSEGISKSEMGNLPYSLDSFNSLSSFNVELSPSLDQVASLQKHKSPYIQNTPRKHFRNSSLSVSSVQGSVYKTPSRAIANPNLSPVNIGLSQGSKVLKTPHSTKKGHARSRSRLSTDLSMNTIAYHNHQIPQKSHNSGGQSMMDPFYTSFGSPNIGGAPFDEVGTPIPMNSTRVRSETNLAYQNSDTAYFSPLGNNWDFTGDVKGGADVAKVQDNGNIQSFRASQLDHIDIVDQDDDALNALKKAKSYSNFGLKHSSNGAQKLMENYKGEVSKSPEVGIAGDDEMFLNAADASWKLTSHALTSHGNEVKFPNSINVSEPENSVPHFGTPGEPAQGSGQEQTEISTMDSQLTGNPYAYGDIGIDLLLPSMMSSNSTSPDFVNQGMNPNSTSELFKKISAPSVDLSNIMTGPQNQSSPSNSGYSGTYYGNPAVNLSSVATSQGQNVLVGSNILTQNLKLPIKMADTAANVDPKKKHACPLCQARFQRPEHVKRHMKSHSSEKPYECDEPNCGKRFNRKDNLKAHLKKIHQRKL